LVSEPEKTTKKMCSFLNIDYEPDMLDISRFLDRSEKNKWEINSAFGDIQDKISKVSISRWKTELKKHEIIFVESIIGLNLFKKFGYEPSEIDYKVEELAKIWKYIRLTPLLQNRLHHWLITGEGVESYPSDPTDPANWAEVKKRKN